MNKNISLEENIDDLFYNNNINVISYDGFDKVKAVSCLMSGDRYVALNSKLDGDERVIAKMHEWEHHKLSLYVRIGETDSRAEEKVRRETMYDFLPEKELRRLILSNGTFDPRILAEESVFSAEEIGYAEYLYYCLKGMEAPAVI